MALYTRYFASSVSSLCEDSPSRVCIFRRWTGTVVLGTSGGGPGGGGGGASSLLSRVVPGDAALAAANSFATVPGR